MKKLLLSSMMLVAGLFAANAAEGTVTFADLNYANAEKLEGKEIKADVITIAFSKDQGTIDPAYYTSGTAARMYAGNKVEFAAPQGSTITKIDFALANQTYNFADNDNAYVASTGTFTADPKEAKTASWTGSAETVSISLKNEKNAAGKYPQFRIYSVTVTFNMGKETKCSNPKFGLEEGKYYTAQEVELTSNTEGCKIMYKVNDGAETEYTAPIKLAEIGKYAISAYAVKEGLENSETVVANYEIAAPVEVASINEFIMQGEADATAAYKWTFPVTVVAQPAGSTYVVDGEGTPLLIYGKEIPAYKEGDVIPAGIVGKFKNYNGLYEMEFPEAATFGAATANNPVAKTFMKAGEITAADQNKVVYITNATVNAADKLFTDASGSIAYFIQKNWGVDIPEGTYDIRCAVAVYKENVQVYPMEFLTAGSGVEDAVAETATIVAKEGAIEVNAEGFVAVFNAAGQAVAGQYVDGVATINVAPGFYIVRAADQVAKVIVK